MLERTDDWGWEVVISWVNTYRTVKTFMKKLPIHMIINICAFSLL